jgi:transposase-like protein
MQEGMSRGASIKAVADLFGVASRTLRWWGLMIRAQGFSHEQRKEADRYVGPPEKAATTAGQQRWLMVRVQGSRRPCAGLHA